MADKDPQLYARVRQESEVKRKIAEAERAVLWTAKRWHAGHFTSAVLMAAVQDWLDVSEVK